MDHSSACFHSANGIKAWMGGFNCPDSKNPISSFIIRWRSWLFAFSRIQRDIQKPRNVMSLKMSDEFDTFNVSRDIAPYVTKTPLSSTNLIMSEADLPPTQFNANRGGGKVSSKIRVVRSSDSVSTSVAPSDRRNSFSSSTLGRSRTTLTHFRPQMRHSCDTAWPTELFPPFWRTVSPSDRCTKSRSIRYAVGGLTVSVAATTGCRSVGTRCSCLTLNAACVCQVPNCRSFGMTWSPTFSLVTFRPIEITSARHSLPAIYGNIFGRSGYLPGMWINKRGNRKVGVLECVMNGTLNFVCGIDFIFLGALSLTLNSIDVRRIDRCHYHFDKHFVVFRLWYWQFALFNDS